MLRSVPFSLALAVYFGASGWSPSLAQQTKLPIHPFVFPTATPSAITIPGKSGSGYKIAQAPGIPQDFTLAAPSDCGRPEVAAAAGGANGCIATLNAGGVIAFWNTACSGMCPPAAFSFRLFDAIHETALQEIDAPAARAYVIPNAHLGDCFVIRAYRNQAASPDSNYQCVVRVTTPAQMILGPSQTGQFHGAVHDNKDHDYFCTSSSWNPTWKNQPWGFMVHTDSVTLDPSKPSSAQLTIERLPQTYQSGTAVAPCTEGLLRVWRAYATFVLPPAVAATATSTQLSYAMSSGTNGTAACTQTIWEAHRWFYRDPVNFGVNDGYGIDDGKMLDSGAVVARPNAYSGATVTADLTGSPAWHGGAISLEFQVQNDGFSTEAASHPSLHSGNYIPNGSSVLCGLSGLTMHVTYEQTQTAGVPAIMRSRVRGLKQQLLPPSLMTKPPPS